VSSSLALSKHLRELSDERLQVVLAERIVSATGIRDFFDLADALLSPIAIDSAVARMPRPMLASLTLATPSAETNAFAVEQLLALETSDGVVIFPEVLARVGEQGVDIDFTQEPLPEMILGESPERQLRERVSLERGLGTSIALEELARAVSDDPLRELARGGLSAADATRLAERMPTGDMIPKELLSLAARASLIERRGGWWLASDAVSTWIAEEAAGRWLTLTHAWFDSLSLAERWVLAERSDWGTSLNGFIEWAYPISSAWLEASIAESIRLGELLGLNADGYRTQLGALVLAGEWEQAEAMALDAVPPYADSVYVQHDLTIVAPGPLRPPAEFALRQLCVVESRGVASTYRLTAGGITAALAAGGTATSILNLLTELSAVELPQPVTYLIGDVADRFGSIRVRAHEAGSVITCDDPVVLRTLGADQSLTALTLLRDAEGMLHSRRDPATVVGALVDARYPAVMINSSGAIVAVPKRTRAIDMRAEHANPHIAVIDRLRGAREETGNDAAQWIARQLDLAVRDRSIIIVTVGLPDGSSRDFTIEPRGLSNGRLRALDRATEVERTLPVGSITALRQAE
jgi:hypothetical protein